MDHSKEQQEFDGAADEVVGPFTDCGSDDRECVHTATPTFTFRFTLGAITRLRETISAGITMYSVVRIRKPWLMSNPDTRPLALPRAIVRGEVDPEIDIDLAMHVIQGPLISMRIVAKDDVGPSDCNALLDMTIRALGAVETVD